MSEEERGWDQNMNRIGISDQRRERRANILEVAHAFLLSSYLAPDHFSLQIITASSLALP
jgi:hypothetical protein